MIRCARPAIVGSLGSVILLSACGGAERAEDSSAAGTGTDSRLSVYVVNYPLQYFAERIGGDLVDVQFPAPADIDPAFWSPDAETVARYQGADLILLNGASYAKWVERMTLPSSKLVNTSASFEDRYMYIEDVVTHTHGPAGEHDHGQIAFTTWLDPTLAVEQARAIQEALATALPSAAETFQSGFESLEGDLLAIDARLSEMTAGRSDQPLLGSHPVYQYLKRRYDLNLVSVNFEPDEVPTEEAWRGLDALLGEHPAPLMLWEGEPLEQTANRLRAMGVESIVFDPSRNAPREGGYLVVMRRNVDNLRIIF